MSDLIILYVKFRAKPGKREDFKRHLFDLVEIMRKEPAFVRTIAHDRPDDPNEISLYEIWRGTRETWLRDEKTNPYRAYYAEGALEQLESRTVEWLIPTDEWKNIGEKPCIGQA
jgi:quinol monooxygenase YgiN